MLEETTRDAEFLVSEANGFRSREQITVAQSRSLAPGTVLGQVSETAKYKRLDPAATDGSETAAGVLYGWTDASTGDRRAVAVVRDAEVARAGLSFAEGMSQVEKDTALAGLAERGIVPR